MLKSILLLSIILLPACSNPSNTKEITAPLSGIGANREQFMVIFSLCQNAANGHRASIHELSNFYKYGEFYNPDNKQIDEAREKLLLLEIKAEKGNADAQFDTAAAYYWGQGDSPTWYRGVQTDFKKAYVWTRLAINNGFTRAANPSILYANSADRMRSTTLAEAKREIAAWTPKSVVNKTEFRASLICAKYNTPLPEMMPFTQ